MEENINYFQKKIEANLIGENRLRNYLNKECVSTLFNKNYANNSNTFFTKRNLTKDIVIINNAGIKEFNNFILANKKNIIPIKIQKDYLNDKYLPLLESDKLKNIKESLNTKRIDMKNLLKNNSKKQSFCLNRSYFSTDKLKLKIKTSLKKNSNKKYLIIKRDTNSNINNNIKMKTTINHQGNNQDNIIQNLSINSSHRNRKKNLSYNSLCLTKKRKFKIKSKSKILSYKSTNDLSLSNISHKSKLFLNDHLLNNKYNEFGIKGVVNMDKKCYYTVRQYLNINKQNLINDNNSSMNEEENESNSKNVFNVGKKNKQMFFSVYHFFDTDNLYFFIPNSKFDDIKQNLINLQISTNLDENKPKYEILENFYLPPAFRPRMNKWKEMPECITGTCKKGGFTLIKNFDNCNLIWRLVHPNKMKVIIRNMHNNQKYNHFISTFHLGRKDNLYKHFKYYKKLFPKMYNYAPATYILPLDGPDFENEYKKNKKALWIVKPVNLSRGRGVHLLRGESEFKHLYKRSTQLSVSQYLISRYIDRPHLLNNKKYDLRIYVLIASFTPLRIYLYNNGLVRFATEDYRRGDFQNIFIHLTNYSINKNNLKYKSNQNLKEQQCDMSFPREETEMTEAEGGIEYDENGDENIPDDDSNKWSLIEYRNNFKKIGKGYIMDLIWGQIEAIAIKTVISVSSQYYKNIFPNKINNTFELYGFDILIDENYKAWLIEVNVNPSLHCTSPLDLSIKTDLISDIFNVVGILPYNHNGNKSIYNYSMAGKKKDEINISMTNRSAQFPINNKIGKNDKENFNNKMNMKTTILKNFEPDNLEKKLPEYDEEYYKKMLENYNEEKMRSHATEFNLIFPLKNNIKKYGEILIKDNAINDFNIVLWQHILTND